jgi:hypothetical protein
MPLWLVVVFLFWIPLVCWVSVLLGAYVMWAKERGANPLTDVKSFVMPGGVVIRQEKDEEGFYE